MAPPPPSRTDRGKTLNLVFVHQPSKLSSADIDAISARISRIAPEIKVFGVLPSQDAQIISAHDWLRPTLTVSFGSVRRFIPPRGPVYENRFVSKLEQFRRFRAIGIETPHTEPFRHGMALDPEQWGPFVIMKPSDPDLTSNGRYLQVFRTASLSERSLPAAHPSRHLLMLLQQWIDSGENLTSYRCLTLFGAVLLGSISRSPSQRPSLDASDAVIEAMTAESDRGHNKKCDDPEIMAFASRMAEAFPRHPILGCDIIREAGTGRLYAIEVNAGGNVWHFSSPRTAPWRTHDNTEKLKRHFSSFDVAAEVLVKKTRAEAR
ncbi:hypothetical protein [Aestuariivirga sp.]|uniref:hypothetical protein n=1 Tax=Aestuariivirga sp. TaxID=2650926 RepID=UPI00391B7A75